MKSILAAVLILAVGVAISQSNNVSGDSSKEAAALADLMKFRESQHKETEILKERTDDHQSAILTMTNAIKELQDRAATIDAKLDTLANPPKLSPKDPADLVQPVAPSLTPEQLARLDDISKRIDAIALALNSQQKPDAIIEKIAKSAPSVCVSIDGVDYDLDEYLAKNFKGYWTWAKVRGADGIMRDENHDQHLIEHGVAKDDLAQLTEDEKRKLHSAIHATEVVSTHKPVASPQPTPAAMPVRTYQYQSYQNCPGGVCPRPASYQNYQAPRSSRGSRRSGRRLGSAETRGPVGVLAGVVSFPFRLAARVLI